MTRQETLQPRRLRLATLAGLAPKKLGSGENRLITFAKAARERGHDWTLFSYEPVHPEVLNALADAGASWSPLTELERRPLWARKYLTTRFDVLGLNLVAPRAPIALAAYAAWPTSVVFIDRVSGAPTGSPAGGSWRSNVSAALDRFTMIRVSQFAGISEYVRARGQKRFSLPAERTRVLYNGVDTDRFRPEEEREGVGSPLRLLVVASLIQEKGIDVLLRAVAQMDLGDWRLQVVGEGPELESLKGLTRQLEIEAKTSFLGLRNDVDVLMRRSDILVHPAIWEEAFGLTVIEGMSSGCCVLASRVGGIPELLEHGSEGLLVEPGNVESLVDHLDRVAREPAIRLELGAAARGRVLRNFDLAKSVRAELDMLEAAI